MKKIFNMPELNITKFICEDIVTTSACGMVEETMKAMHEGVKTANVEWNSEGNVINFTL